MLTQRGYTLLEMVLVIVLVGLLASAAVPLLVEPAKQYRQNTDRLNNVQAADRIEQFLDRQFAQVVPNTLTVQPEQVQWLGVTNIGKYADNRLRPNCEPLQRKDDRFDMIDDLAGASALVIHPASPQAVRNDWLAGGNSGSVLRDPGNQYQRRLPSSARDCGTGAWTEVSLPSRHDFAPALNNQQRVFAVDHWRALSCQNDQLRYHTSDMPMNTFNDGQILASDLASCQFTYVPGNAAFAPQVVLSIDFGESNRLELAYELYNAP